MLYVWSGFVRVSHWLLAAAFAVAFVYSDSIWQLDIHVAAGYVAGAVLLARIGWGVLARGYCNFARFPFRPLAGLRYARDVLSGRARRFIGHNPAGSVVIYGMLALGLVTTGSGLVVLNDAYLPFPGDNLATLHHYAAWGWLALVAVHVCGVVVESVLQRENLIATMITGFKSRHAGARRHDALHH